MVSTKPLVLVTGATGLIGFRTLVLTLVAGYRTRIVFRRSGQPEKLKATKSIKPFLDDIEFVQVSDITKSDAFDEAVKDVEYVLHVASPVFDMEEDVEEVTEFYDPAVKGTMSALTAAAKSPSVKRVIITSSVVALDPKEGSTVAGPTDLRVLPPKEVLASFNRPGPAYIFSKTLSHGAVTDCIRDHLDSHFDVVRVLPGFTQSGNELAETVDAILSSSSGGVLNTALGIIKPAPKPMGQVHLDDVARTHVEALDKGKVAGGQVLIAVANHGAGWRWDDFVPVIERLYPEEVKAGILSPKKGQEDWAFKLDVEETYKTVGFEFKGMEEMVKSVVERYLELKGHVAN